MGYYTFLLFPFKHTKVLTANVTFSEASAFIHEDKYCLKTTSKATNAAIL